LAELLN
jgi:secreted Zn-dependent insulinase-like peptidase